MFLSELGALECFGQKQQMAVTPVRPGSEAAPSGERTLLCDDPEIIGQFLLWLITLSIA